MPLKRKLLVALGLLGIICLGFYREFVFVHINEHLFALWYDEPSRASDWIPFIKSMDYYPLYYSKWGLTFLFSALFYGAIALNLKWFYGHYYWKELGAVYAVLFGGAALALGVGWLSNTFGDAYLIARFLMGIAQSPLLLMVFWLGVRLRKAQAA